MRKMPRKFNHKENTSYLFNKTPFQHEVVTIQNDNTNREQL